MEVAEHEPEIVGKVYVKSNGALELWLDQNDASTDESIRESVEVVSPEEKTTSQASGAADKVEKEDREEEASTSVAAKLTDAIFGLVGN